MKQIHEQYVDYAKEIVHSFLQETNFKVVPKILKTDCWNEAMKNFEIAPLFEDCCCVDIDVEIIKKASNNFEKIKAFYGDIRDLPFWDRHFDIILDFSTIDHIEDYKKAIDEYFRVLKNKGLMLIVSWFSDKKELQVGNKDEWGMQYYFDRKEFEKKLEEKFTILKKEPLEQTLNNERYLFMFWCEKK